MSGSAGLRTESKTIEGKKFIVAVFPGLQGLRIKGRLVKLIGPALGGVAAGLTIVKGKTVMESDVKISKPEAIGKAIMGLTDRLDDESVIQLIMDLVAFTQIDGRPIDEAVFNLEFAGNYMVLYQVLFFVIETNRFFGKGNIGNMLGRLEQRTANIPENSQSE